MTISIWRYSHLALAVSSFVFIVLASVTGIILAFQPISEQLEPYNVANLDNITLAETVTVFQDNYPEIIDIKVDANDFVIATVFTEDGNNLSGYFNPQTAEYLGEELKPSPFFQWVTNFHRSLFLKSVGRFFVGLCSFLLFLIAVTGTILIIKRQHGFKRFFSKIINEDFNQYWHVVLGRLSLLPIIIITITGVYLSLEKFDALPKTKTTHQVDFDTLIESPKQNASNFSVFTNTSLSEVKHVEFPFSSDVEDYFTVKLHDKDLLINQFTGAILSEVNTPKVEVFSALSLNLHTGKGSILWSIILAVATANILFFVYSGFAMTLKRRKSRLKNKVKAEDADIIILVGSENGSSIHYANMFFKQLIKQNQNAFIAEMNAYQQYPNAKHLVVMTATYGQGDAPTNANQFLQKLKEITNTKDLKFSVVGFGSLAYPDFCQFAYDVDQALQQVYKPVLPIFTINDKSVDAFSQWVSDWSEVSGISVTIPQKHLTIQPKQLKKLKVISKTKTNVDNTFLITLKPKKHHQFTSGDLLAVYPKNDYRERLYSIGKVAGNIQLSVKLHENGLGSGFLHSAADGDKIKVRLVKNSAFHCPKKAKQILMIANGTGVAPFLGMLQQNKKVESHLYLGLRTEESYQIYQEQIKQFLFDGKLTKHHLALSRVGDKHYVQDLLKRDAKAVAKLLYNNCVIMICGSLAMHKSVMSVLEEITVTYNNKPLSYYQNKQQIKSDCY
ncbi:PepSY domain-containing protein [Mangrovimonas spongiae]|uniref:FAD-binding oxidoreductase n=1 Tax=Mangrovimonas spongiae TaxID=2494697 RepID=A0A428K5D4_9FLAO|nr:PepSY domain-containing protein [Mangrovimonas spongiae]RSK41648.1 FAD-binding oxidoreductase [Mangrovimonas spongiae]